MQFLNICLQTYLSFNELISGMLMGSPVTGVIGEAVPQRLVDIAMSGYQAWFLTWFFDGTFVIIQCESLSSFQSSLGSIFLDIQFTVEEEKAQ